MKKCVFVLLSLIVVLVGCNKKEDVGNLKEIAKHEMDNVVAGAKSRGADVIITDTLVCNDSVCIFSTINTDPRSSTIPFEYLFLRKRIKTGYEYYGSCHFVGFGKKSVSDKVFKGLSIANAATMGDIMNDEKKKEVASRILFTIAYDDCTKHGVKIKDIKK